MANKIGVLIAVDGEREFRDAMTNASSAVQATKAEIKALTTEFSENANSLKALTAKQEALERHQKHIKNALKTAKEGYDNAKSAVEKHTKAVDEWDKKVQTAKADERRNSRALSENEKYVDEAKRSTDNWANALIWQQHITRNITRKKVCSNLFFHPASSLQPKATKIIKNC